MNTVENKYSVLTDQQVYEWLMACNYFYQKIINSEKAAKALVESSNLPFCYCNDEFKAAYFELLEEAQTRGFPVDYTFSPISIEIDDIIGRINECKKMHPELAKNYNEIIKKLKQEDKKTKGNR